MPPHISTVEILDDRLTEHSSADYLYKTKWPDGFRCPRCNGMRSFLIETRRLPLFECADCHYQASLTAGTIMEGSRTPLTKWFTAIHLVSRTDKGISATELGRRIRVTYKTAWLILHKIRHAMSIAQEACILSGTVHVNNFTYGRPYNSTIFRHPQEQPLLAAATTNDRHEPVCLKIQAVPHAHLRGRAVSDEGTDAFIMQNVDPNLSDRVLCFTARFGSPHDKKLLPLLKKMNHWINDTFCGIGPKYLQAYLSEFGCRFNLVQKGEPVFKQLMWLCTKTPRITAPELKSTQLISEFPAYQDGSIYDERFTPFAEIRYFVSRHHSQRLFPRGLFQAPVQQAQ